MSNNKTNKTNREIKRGDIFYMDLGIGVGSEQGGRRPVLVIQNNIGNKFSPVVIVATITSSQTKKKMPTHFALYEGQGGLAKQSTVLLEQINTVDKSRLEDKVGSLSSGVLREVDKRLKVSLGIEF